MLLALLVGQEFAKELLVPREFHHGHFERAGTSELRWIRSRCGGTMKERRSGEVEPESEMAPETSKGCRSGEVEPRRRGMWRIASDCA